jgi:hypothetical protein
MSVTIDYDLTGAPQNTSAPGSGLTAADLAAATSKTTPVDADSVPLTDSAASNALKKLTWANLKATLKTYFDTLYQAVLVSGTNIKTINGASVLGSGDLTVSGGGTPGGSSGQIQYNNAGAFGGSLLTQGTNIITQANGTNPQAYRLQRSFVSSGNEGYTSIEQGSTAGLILDSVNTGSVSAPTNLLDVRGNGTSRFSVAPDSTARAGSFFLAGSAGIQTWFSNAFYLTASVPQIAIAANVFRCSSGVVMSWSSGATDSAGADTGSARNAAGVVEINNGTAGTFRDLKLRTLIATQGVQLTAATVATLPAAASNTYTGAAVSDASSPAVGSTVSGGGSAKAIVRSNGTNWIVTEVI